MWLVGALFAWVIRGRPMVEHTGTKLLACVVTFMGMMVASKSASSATLHVSSLAGGDGDGTAAAPFKTVSAAVEGAGDGDTIVIAKGNYHVDSAITVDKPGIKIIGVSGERPVISAGEDVSTVFNVIASDVVLQDIAIQGGFYGVKVDVDDDRPTRNVIIRNCVIASTAADCIKSFNADGLRIEGCQIGPSGLKQRDNAEGIDIIGSIGVVVRGCVIQDVATNGVYLKGGTRDGIIERCLIQRAGHAGILLGQDTDEESMRNGAANEATNCVARNNIVVDTQAAGLGAYSAMNVSFLNNTLVNVAQENQAGIWIVTNSREVPSEQVILRNNIVSVGGDRLLMFIKDAVGLPDSDFNLFNAAQGEPRIVREMTASESLNRQWSLAQWQKATGKDAHSRMGEPRLDKRQFRPLAGSPAIGGGESGKVQDDYFGRKRTGEMDAGAIMASAGAGTAPN